MAAKMSKDQLKWQAESDAHTMAEYQRILGDKPRMNRAIKVAKQRAAELSQRANDMQGIAKFKYGGRKK